MNASNIVLQHCNLPVNTLPDQRSVLSALIMLSPSVESYPNFSASCSTDHAHSLTIQWSGPIPDLQDLKKELVYTRISGYGQTGPKSTLPGYASVCEGFGGLRCGLNPRP